MSIRLQVILDEEEMSEIRRSAERQRMTVSEWVRQALRSARRREPERDPERKIEAIRAATRHRFPAPPVDRMLEEIELGYRDDRE